MGPNRVLMGNEKGPQLRIERAGVTGSTPETVLLDFGNFVDPYGIPLSDFLF